MDLVPHSNTNLKKLTIGTNLLRPLTSAINNVTSLTYLEIIEPQSSDLPVLTKIVLLHSSLETLKIGNIQTDDTSPNRRSDTLSNLLQLIEAGNNRLKTLILADYYRLLPDSRQLYEHLLKYDEC